ncbi:MAG TPA: periplasmic heavy metal sensor [Ignavibacteria bacterium]|nr:periplasmic heavy metal sensor [Ignavibacteria bacterium]
MVRDKFLILVIIFLFVLNLFTLGYLFFERQPPPPDGMMNERFMPPDGPDIRDNRKPGRPDLIIEKLKFNESQQKQFEGLKKEHRSQVEKLQDSSRILHDEYFGLLKQDSYDSRASLDLLAKISENQKELDKVTFEHFEKIKNICDSEQKKQFAALIDEIAHSFKLSPPKR